MHFVICYTRLAQIGVVGQSFHDAVNKTHPGPYGLMARTGLPRKLAPDQAASRASAFCTPASAASQSCSAVTWRRSATPPGSTPEAQRIIGKT